MDSRMYTSYAYEKHRMPLIINAPISIAPRYVRLMSNAKVNTHLIYSIAQHLKAGNATEPNRAQVAQRQKAIHKEHARHVADALVVNDRRLQQDPSATTFLDAASLNCVCAAAQRALIDGTRAAAVVVKPRQQ